ncbi:MAG: FAD-dependent oxidoreductase, partial [Rhodothermales bacterium]|nr:FAD-dependent oxidoreductase [Rhodothermales bacterium]
AVGGRVRTDIVDGFRLDWGFQVLQTAYPEAQRQFDYDALRLKPFYSGALVRFDGRFHRLADPFRHLLDATGTILSPIGTFKDKLRVAKLRSELINSSLADLFARDEMTTMEALRDRYHFSENIIERFFRPFFGGIFFDPALQTSSRMFDFVFRMFALGDTALPAEGMEALPRQLAAALPPAALRLGHRADAVEEGGVRLHSGEVLSARAVVVATDAPAAQALADADAPAAHHATTCLYYAASASPHDEPILVLNGDGEGPINNVAVLTDAAPSYAPEGQTLISVTVLGDPDLPDERLETRVRGHLADWYGAEVGTWRHLRTYRVRYALPALPPPRLDPPERPVRLGGGRYVCGDHRATASIQGALRSGRHAAEAILADLA